MKKISKIFAMLVVALVGLSLTACSDGDDLGFGHFELERLGKRQVRWL